uniref:Uncharacterized protein n=1 Tax=Kalanchoe fedtschenkoi TaxID=63787 RepID=A0A7N0V4Y1_KALFE
MSRRSGTWVRCSLVTFAIVSALCVCGPALYWRFSKSVPSSDSASSSSCAPCHCNCPEPVSLLQVPGLANLSVTDCGSNDPELKSEMEKQFVDLLTEELKLHEMVADERARHMNTTFIEAKRAASQYQNEAEKCNAATDICEGARERAEALLIKERKITSLWEKRARNMGWAGE